jgi:hypothetical protein
MSKLALTLVATIAAPTSPNVLGRELLIEDPGSAIKARNSPYKASTAIRRDRPISTIIVLLELKALKVASALIISITPVRGVSVVSVWNVIRGLAVVGLANCSHVRLSAVSDSRRVWVLNWP